MTYGDAQKRKLNGLRLGQAKNQATTFLTSLMVNKSATGILQMIASDGFKKVYKETAKIFYKLNEELEKEVLGDGN